MAVSVVSVSVREAVAESPAPSVIVGSSLVPVIVIVTVWSAVPELLSVARIVYVSVSVSPAAR